MLFWPQVAGRFVRPFCVVVGAHLADGRLGTSHLANPCLAFIFVLLSAYVVEVCAALPVSCWPRFPLGLAFALHWAWRSLIMFSPQQSQLHLLHNLPVVQVIA